MWYFSGFNELLNEFPEVDPSVEGCEIQTIDALMVQIEQCKTGFPDKRFRLYHGKSENDSGYMEFDETGSLVDFTGSNSVIMEYTRAYTYLCICDRFRKQDAIAANKQKVIRLISLVIGGGAAIKAFSGTYSFFQTVIGLEKDPHGAILTNLFAALSAVPAVAFYSRSLSGVSLMFIHEIMLSIRLRKLAVEEVKLLMPALVKRAFPDLKLSQSKLQILADILLGIGYGSANVGMVLESFPSYIDTEALKVLLLICTAITNGWVGIDKSRKVTDDIKEFWSGKMEFWTGKSHGRVEKIRIDVLVEALKHYQQMLAKDADKGKEKFRELKDAFGSCDSIDSMILLVDEKIGQQQKRMDAEKSRKLLLSRDNLMATVNPDEDDPLLVRFTPMGINAEDRPFSYRRPFTQAWTWANRGLGVFSWVVSTAAIMSNIDGVTVLLKLITGATDSWPVLGCYIGGIIASVAALGLNKSDTDAWKDKFIGTFSEKLELELNSGQAKGCGIGFIEILGLIWSALSATAGVYFTKQAIDNLSIFENSFMYWLQWFIRTRPVEYFCLGATGLLTTTTKAVPTADLIRSFTGALKCCKSEAPVTLNVELVAYQDSILKILMDGLGNIIEHHNNLCDRLPSEVREELALKPIDYRQYCESINIELSDSVGRADAINILKIAISRLEKKYLKAITAVQDAGCCCMPVYRSPALNGF